MGLELRLRMIIGTPAAVGPTSWWTWRSRRVLRGLSLFRDEAPPRMLALSSVDDDIGEGITMSGSRPRVPAQQGAADDAFPLCELPLWRMAGSLAVAAGSLFTLAQLGQLATLDRTDINGSLADPLFRAFSIAYAAAFVPMVLALVAVYLRQAQSSATFGLVAFGAAVFGTMWLGANMWFEAFCAPWLLEAVPTLLTFEKAVIWQVGYLSSYALFALGWMLFGVSCLRARVYPSVAGVAIAISGAIGFFAAQPPFGAPLGLAVAVLGVWLWRSNRATSAPHTAREGERARE